jgi:hypothetical protein
MPLVNIPFQNINASIGVGDILYYSTPTNLGTSTFDATDISNTIEFGVVQSVGTPTFSGGVYTTVLGVLYPATVNSPPTNALWSFVKDKKVNNSSLLGYYMQATFSNNSTKKVELFSIGSEFSESSK